MRPARTLVLLAILLAACGPGGGPTITLRGVAVAGPTCPVVTDPPDPSCEDRPVAGARIVVRDADGTEVGVAVTDEDGHFSVSLAEGSYELEPQPVTGLMGTAAPVTIAIRAGEEPEPVMITYDTGIR
jgi:carboxypeptidase family protein/Big-like domain-containing protein